MSEHPPKPPNNPATTVQSADLVHAIGSGRVEDMTLRLLRDMRTDHAASMEAMRTALAANAKVFANMEKIYDRLDTMNAELSTFRAETERNFRALQNDVISAEGRIISRQMEIAEAVNRISDLELVIPAAE